MDAFLAICQALGLGLALGIGGPLVALFVAVMAAAGAGFDPAGTDWEFLGSEWFVLAMLVANVLGFYADRAGQVNPTRAAVFAAAIGAIAGAAALAAEGESALIGLVVGGGGGLLAGAIAGAVLAGARRRAEQRGAGAAALPLLFAAVGIAVATLALFAPPSSLAVLAALLLLGLRRRRRAGEKYEGLRVLR